MRSMSFLSLIFTILFTGCSQKQPQYTHTPVPYLEQPGKKEEIARMEDWANKKQIDMLKACADCTVEKIFALSSKSNDFIAIANMSVTLCQPALDDFNNECNKAMKDYQFCKSSTDRAKNTMEKYALMYAGKVVESKRQKKK